LKARCIEVLQEFVSEFQERKKAITDDDVRMFSDSSKPMEDIKF